MSDQHKPLTAAEIEELKALEEQASKGTWVVEKPFSHPGVQAVKMDGSFDWICHAQVSNCPGWLKDSVFIAAARNALPRLLSMLTPPTDAEVREAVNNLALTLRMLGESPPERVCIPVPWLRTLLRAVQAPRLTVEQKESALHLLSEMDKMLGEDMQPDEARPAALAMQRFCAAFPGLFGKEG